MPEDYDLALRQADAARADFAAIGDELEFIRIQLSALPTRQELVRTVLLACLPVRLSQQGWRWSFGVESGRRERPDRAGWLTAPPQQPLIRLS